jgi:hypothetical protein
VGKRVEEKRYREEGKGWDEVVQNQPRPDGEVAWSLIEGRRGEVEVTTGAGKGNRRKAADLGEGERIWCRTRRAGWPIGKKRRQRRWRRYSGVLSLNITHGAVF